MATWLLWAMSWRGVTTVRQPGGPPLHVSILVVRWRTGMPGTLYFGPAAPLLRVLADCAARLYRVPGMERLVKRMRVSGGDSLDPRIVRIKFTPLMPDRNSTPVIDRSQGKQSFASLVCANCQQVTNLLSRATRNQALTEGVEGKTRLAGHGVTPSLPRSDEIASLHVYKFQLAPVIDASRQIYEHAEWTW